MCISLTPYTNEYKSQWNQVVEQADNGHFMIDRDYMEYHSDRFEDASYIVFKKNKIIGAIPGNRNGNIWYSHQGLTFGGVLLIPKYNRMDDYSQIYQQLFYLLKQEGYTHGHIKIIPHIYHKNPCENELFIIHPQAEKTILDVSTAVDLRENSIVSNLRMRGFNKAVKNQLSMKENNDFNYFWPILSNRLKERHNKIPVHTVKEMQYLKSKFPDNIKLYTAVDNEGKICGGTVVYETQTTAHAQYIAANEEGLEYGALDFIFLNLFDKYRVINIFAMLN